MQNSYIAQSVYVIRGTGFNIDGTLVLIESDAADSHVKVSPVNQKDYPATGSILIDRRYLSPAKTYNGTHEYRISISCTSTVNSDKPETEVCSYNITDAVRKVNLKELVESIASNLKPILTKE